MWSDYALGTQEVNNGEGEIVAALRQALAQRLGDNRYEFWFGAGTAIHYADQVLRVSVATPAMADWIRQHFARDLLACCQDVTGCCPALELVADEELRSAGPHQGPPIQPSRPSTSSVARRAPGSGPPAGATGLQFALGEWAAGQVNKLALTSARILVDRTAAVNLVCFHGPTAVGKTHLLQGICQETRRTGRTAAYLSAQEFTAEFVSACRNGGMPAFRARYRGAELLAIDDCQFFCGKRATADELLHTVDVFLRSGGQLALAADRPPGELNGLSAELVTRLASGLVCPIEHPDVEARRQIVLQRARRLEVELPPDVCELIAVRITSHARELAGVVNRLHATSLADERPIDLAMAEGVLASCVSGSGRVPRLKDIEQAVCDVFGLEERTLQSDAKARGVSHPRMLAMWLARKYTRAALSEIGHYFGRRSHSTVVLAQHKVAGWIARNEELQVADQACRVEEAIRRVERQLRVG